MKNVLLGMAAAIATLIVAEGAAGCGVIINTTASEPRGLWLATVDDEPVRAGDLVLICPPDDPQTRRYVPPGRCPNYLAPLIKEVAAVAGDTVAMGEDGVTVNGEPMYAKPLALDTGGRPLKAYTGGQVHAGEVFVLSTYSLASYDSRYFGPLQTWEIIGHVRPLWTIE